MKCKRLRKIICSLIHRKLLNRFQMYVLKYFKRIALSLCFRINSGFEEQLHLYESLRCEVDTSSPLYKQYRLQKITEKYPGTAHSPKAVNY